MRRLPILVAAWTLLFCGSHLVRRGRDIGELAAGEREIRVRVVNGDAFEHGLTRLVYVDRGTENRALPVLLLHGSPGDNGDFNGLGEELVAERRVIAPDLPGFGGSAAALPDYSIRSHAHYVLQLLDELALERVHAVGFGSGGGVALELTDLAPSRVGSLTLLSCGGVQELELLGDYHLNHAVHGLQLALLWSLYELVPHFGLLDGASLSVAYARNRFDTDQRPLRSRLRAWKGPTLVLHGDADALVPLSAAREHQRLVPQAELGILPGGHSLLADEPALLASRLEPFLAAVEAGTAAGFDAASAARKEAAARPYDPSALEPLAGLALVLFFFLAALGTLVSEDLTCIAVGAMVGQGRVSFLAGVAACFVGIYVGDVLLFLAGRFLGARALARAPWRWFVSETRVARASRWFERRGPTVIFLSRFLPGMRLPTYFASGLLRTSFLRFSLWFALAGAVWTPLLVGLSSRMGGEISDRSELLQRNLTLLILVTLGVVFLVVRVARALLTRRGRRLFRSSWRRLVRWEYWPIWVFYPPIALACVVYGLRRRHLLAFTAANPALPLGGFVGESKREILRGLAASPEHLPRTAYLPFEGAGDARVARAREIREREGLALPLVLKPDQGERGEGVRILRTEEDFERAVRESYGDQLLQEFVAGEEFGLFWARRPSEARGRLLSITVKALPFVVGDGRSALEELILVDARAVGMARFFLDSNADRLAEVPRAGERVLLGELGTHCRGAAFSDGGHLRSRALEDALERIARGFAGFYIGRFDVRAVSVEALRAGHFRILELNGVTAEAAHVYDARYSVLDAWKTIARQWELAYEIGAENLSRGARASGLRELLLAAIRARARRVARERARIQSSPPRAREAAIPVNAVALERAGR